jgi:hypothetical protein
MVGDPEVDPHSGPAPIRLRMLVGRMNPLAVRIHVGVAEKRIKTSDKRSSLPNEIIEIAPSSRTDIWLPR